MMFMTADKNINDKTKPTTRTEMKFKIKDG